MWFDFRIKVPNGLKTDYQSFVKLKLKNHPFSE